MGNSSEYNKAYYEKNKDRIKEAAKMRYSALDGDSYEEKKEKHNKRRKNRYSEDEEYRKRTIERNKQYRAQRKLKDNKIE